MKLRKVIYSLFAAILLSASPAFASCDTSTGGRVHEAFWTHGSGAQAAQFVLVQPTENTVGSLGCYFIEAYPAWGIQRDTTLTLEVVNPNLDGGILYKIYDASSPELSSWVWFVVDENGRMQTARFNYDTVGNPRS